MEFKEVKSLLIKHINKMVKDATHLFTVEIGKQPNGEITDVLWETYINNFPAGANPLFRKKGEHECSACRRFIRQFGSVVAIRANKLVSIWDVDITDAEYSPSFKALAKLVKSEAIKNVYFAKESLIGVERNVDNLDPKIKWEHYAYTLPSRFVLNTRTTSIEAEQAKYRDSKNCYQRAMVEITRDSIETVLELIAQKSLYKGEEHKAILEKLLRLNKEYAKVPEKERDNYAWVKSIEVGEAVSRVRNHLIGMLLVEISSGTELDEAVRKYEAGSTSQLQKTKSHLYQKDDRRCRKDVGRCWSVGIT